MINEECIIEGRIIKGVGGLYTVLCENGETVTCPAKGIFRLEGRTPYVGDLVRVEIAGANTVESASAPESADGADGKSPAKAADSVKAPTSAVISEILPRRSLSVRPPIANIDRLLMVISSRSPVPNALVIDRLIALAECKGIEPLLLFTKTDLGTVEPWLSTYRNAGFLTAACDLTAGVTSDGAPVRDALLGWFEGHVTALCGNSGVGKTTLLRLLIPGIEPQTGEVSKKLGRGRHTTRQTELYPVAGGFIADTPGFSSWDAESGELMTAEALPRGFREFSRHAGECRFDDCRHTVEKGCAILKAVKNGEIARSRHESYCALMNEVKGLQDWQLEKRANVIK